MHFMWSAQESPPYVRMHWAQSNGALTHTEFTPQMPADTSSPAPDFTIRFQPEGVDPIAPIARDRAYLVLTKEGLTPIPEC